MNVVKTLKQAVIFFFCFFFSQEKNHKICSRSNLIFSCLNFDLFLISIHLEKEGKLHYRTLKVKRSRKTRSTSSLFRLS